MDRFRASLTSKLKTLAPNIQKIAQDTYSKIKEIPQQIQPLKEQLSMQFRVHDQDLIPITNNLYWMAFPANNKVQSLSKHLNKTFGNNYYIWNLSEHEYPTEWFQNQVASHIHKGYPSPSLLEIFTICKSILNWLASDEQNVAIVNCQQTKCRSILILSILVALQTRLNPGEVLLAIAKITNIDDFHALFPTQHLYLTYAENVLNGLKPNSTPLRLVSVIISQIPRHKTPTKFAPYLQLFRNGMIIYNSLQTKEIKRYDEAENSVLFQIGGIDLHDDILVRCKHFENNELRLSFFRLMFNTGFVYNNVLRFSERELDMSSEFSVQRDFFIDMIFERGFQKSSQLQSEGKPVVVPEKKISEDFTQLVLTQAKACQQLVESCPQLQLDGSQFAGFTEIQNKKPAEMRSQENVGVADNAQHNQKPLDIPKQQIQEIEETKQRQLEPSSQQGPKEQFQPSIAVPDSKQTDEELLTEEHEEESDLPSTNSKLMEKILESDNKDLDLDDEADDYISTLTKDI